MIRKEHLKLIAGHSVKHGLRGGAGLISLLLTLVLGLVMASIVISPLESVERRASELSQMTDRGHEATTMQVRGLALQLTTKAIDFAVSPTPDQLDYLVNTHPAAVSAILVLLFLIVPLLSCLGGFNQTSGDIGSKGLRFLLFRTERPNIFLGRFIGTFLFSAAVYLVLFAILDLYIIAKIHIPGHTPANMTFWLFSGYLRLLVFALPYVALCALISCAIDSPFGALMICLLIAYVLPLVLRVATGITGIEQLGYLNFLTPWGYKWWMLAPVTGLLLPGVAVMLGFSVLFLFGGLKYFSARDL